MGPTVLDTTLGMKRNSPANWKSCVSFSDCIEYPGCKTKRGYGSMRYQGRTQLAHRVAMQKHLGRPLRWDAEVKEVVCHRCDNPPCWNIEHLFVGTQTDNMRDA